MPRYAFSDWLIQIKLPALLDAFRAPGLFHASRYVVRGHRLDFRAGLFRQQLLLRVFFELKRRHESFLQRRTDDRRAVHLDEHRAPVAQRARQPVSKLARVDVAHAVEHRHAFGKNRAVHVHRQNGAFDHRENHGIGGMRVHDGHHIGARPVNSGVNFRLVRALAVPFELLRIEVNHHHIVRGDDVAAHVGRADQHVVGAGNAHTDVP